MILARLYTALAGDSHCPQSRLREMLLATLVSVRIEQQSICKKYLRAFSSRLLQTVGFGGIIRLTK